VDEPTEAEIAAEVDSAVQMFLLAYAVAPKR
jgi:hypothetical protein